MDRSALVVIVSVSPAVLLPLTGSLVLLLTVAVFVLLAVVDERTPRSTLFPYTTLFRSVPTVQVLLLKLPWVTVVEPSVKPAGKVSATDTLWASDRPELHTAVV